MSEECKRRLDVQTILRKVILLGLEKMKQDGWGVMEFANASFQRADKVCLMNLIRTEREGWQAWQNEMTADGYKRKDEWIETQHWQLHFICKRKKDDATADAYLSEDVAQLMIAWFNGRGCEELRKYRMANLVIDTESIFVYNDDSDLYQKRAVFTVKIQVPKEISSDDVEAEVIQPKVLPV